MSNGSEFESSKQAGYEGRNWAGCTSDPGWRAGNDKRLELYGGNPESSLYQGSMKNPGTEQASIPTFPDNSKGSGLVLTFIAGGLALTFWNYIFPPLGAAIVTGTVGAFIAMYRKKGMKFFVTAGAIAGVIGYHVVPFNPLMPNTHAPHKMNGKPIPAAKLLTPTAKSMDSESAKEIAKGEMEKFAGTLTVDSVRACAQKYEVSELSEYDAGALWYLKLPSKYTSPFCQTTGYDKLPHVAMQFKKATRYTTPPAGKSQQTEELYLYTGQVVTPLMNSRLDGRSPAKTEAQSVKTSIEALNLAQENVSTTAFNVLVSVQRDNQGKETMTFTTKDGSPFVARPEAKTSAGLTPKP